MHIKITLNFRCYVFRIDKMLKFVQYLKLKQMDKDNIKTLDIEIAIFEKYDIKQHIIVPNVSAQMGLVPFETDMLVVTKSWYATGFEIKVSKSDLLADLNKMQYKLFNNKEYGSVLQEDFYAKKFKYFYYAVPKQLQEIALQTIPYFVGLYVYEKHDYPKLNTFKKVREAKKLHSKSWTDKDVIELMRLGTMRIYSLKKRELRKKY